MDGDKKARKTNKDVAPAVDREWYIKKAMDENHGIFLILGGMYTGHIWISVLYFLLTAWHMPNLSIAVIISWEDLVVVSETGHFIILLSLAFSTAVYYLRGRDKLDRIYEAIGRKYYDYENSLDPVSLVKIDKIVKDSDRRKLMIKYVYYVGVIGALTSISVIRPLLQYFLREYIVLKKLRYGVNGDKNTFIYYPWDPSNFWLNIFGGFLQDVYTLITTMIVFGYALSFFYMGESILVQLEKLKVSLSRIKVRAAHVSGLDPKLPNIVNNEEFRKALHICLKHSVKHHQVVLNIFDDYKTINHFALLWLIYGQTLLLCMCTVLFTADDVSILSKVTIAFFLSSELLQTFIQCWYGERLAGISSDLPLDLYNTDWYRFSKDVLIYHRMLVMRCTQPMQMTAGGFTKISRNTFLDVIRTAFSYANLMQASNNSDKIG